MEILVLSRRSPAATVKSVPSQAHAAPFQYVCKRNNLSLATRLPWLARNNAANHLCVCHGLHLAVQFTETEVALAGVGIILRIWCLLNCAAMSEVSYCNTHL